MKKILLIALVGLIPSAAFAAAGGTSPGGSDSCGLGWQVTDKKTMVATTTRGTTNYFIPYTFGITTGTMGCEKHDFAKKEVEAAVYAANNVDTLNIDFAKGQGEYLTAFAQSMGCNDSDVNMLGAEVKRNYGSISSSANGVELYKAVRSVIRGNSRLAVSCTNAA